MPAFDWLPPSPHIGRLTSAGSARLAARPVQNILDFFAGRLDPALVVNGFARDGRKEMMR